MATLQKAITDRLAADALLTAAPPAGLGFTVWDRWLKRDGAGKTPAAFDAANGDRLRRSIVVLAGAEVDATGRQPGRDGRRWDSYPRLYLFAEAHANGKQAIDEAKLRIEAQLIGWEAVITGGQRVSLRPADEIALEDSEQFPGNVVLVVRWRASGARRFS